jgi:hypothetical protein
LQLKEEFGELGTTERELQRKRMIKEIGKEAMTSEGIELIDIIKSNIGEKFMKAMGYKPGMIIGKQKIARPSNSNLN